MHLLSVDRHINATCGWSWLLSLVLWKWLSVGIFNRFCYCGINNLHVVCACCAANILLVANIGRIWVHLFHSLYLLKKFFVNWFSWGASDRLNSPKSWWLFCLLRQYDQGGVWDISWCGSLSICLAAWGGRRLACVSGLVGWYDGLIKHIIDVGTLANASNNFETSFRIRLSHYLVVFRARASTKTRWTMTLSIVTLALRAIFAYKFVHSDNFNMCGGMAWLLWLWCALINPAILEALVG